MVTFVTYMYIRALDETAKWRFMEVSNFQVISTEAGLQLISQTTKAGWHIQTGCAQRGNVKLDAVGIREMG
jgi:hypothetical protein